MSIRSRWSASGLVARLAPMVQAAVRWPGRTPSPLPQGSPTPSAWAPRTPATSRAHMSFRRSRLRPWVCSPMVGSGDIPARAFPRGTPTPPSAAALTAAGWAALAARTSFKAGSAIAAVRAAVQAATQARAATRALAIPARVKWVRVVVAVVVRRPRTPRKRAGAGAPVSSGRAQAAQAQAPIPATAAAAAQAVPMAAFMSVACAVRVIWGPNRAFPSMNTGPL